MVDKYTHTLTQECSVLVCTHSNTHVRAGMHACIYVVNAYMHSQPMRLQFSSDIRNWKFLSLSVSHTHNVFYWLYFFGSCFSILHYRSVVVLNLTNVPHTHITVTKPKQSFKNSWLRTFGSTQTKHFVSNINNNRKTQILKRKIDEIALYFRSGKTIIVEWSIIINFIPFSVALKTSISRK